MTEQWEGGPVYEISTRPVIEEILEAFERPLPTPGTRVRANGRLGTIVEWRPGWYPGLKPGLVVTCTSTYRVDHDGEIETYVCNDWDYIQTSDGLLRRRNWVEVV